MNRIGEYIADDNILTEAVNAAGIYDSFQENLEAAAFLAVQYDWRGTSFIPTLISRLFLEAAKKDAIRFKQLTGEDMPIEGHTSETSELREIIIKRSGSATVKFVAHSNSGV
jgi:hypothetical protein